MEAVALSSFTAVPSTAAYLDCSISPPPDSPMLSTRGLVDLNVTVQRPFRAVQRSVVPLTPSSSPRPYRLHKSASV